MILSLTAFLFLLIRHLKYRIEISGTYCQVYPWPRKSFSFKLDEVSQFQKVYNDVIDLQGFKIWVGGKQVLVYPPVSGYDEISNILEKLVKRKLKVWDNIL